MSRLYFDCPIQALYMMREFGVKFPSLEKEFFLDEIHKNKTHQYYVAKESEHIFEVKASDFVTNSHKENLSRHCHGFACEPNGLNNRLIAITTPERHNGKTHFVENISQLKIIMRNNKPFFTALVEE